MREVKKSELIDNIASIRKSVSDRALLRSYHYFTENDRVDLFEKTINTNTNNICKLLSIINESGNSSQTILQNHYSLNSDDRSLDIIEITLKELKMNSYAVKVCGGGFGGGCILFASNNDLPTLKKHFKENILFIKFSK